MEGVWRHRARPVRRAPRRAQATLEFAVVAPLFLLCFLASVDAGLWAVQNSAEVASIETAARAAAAAGANPVDRSPPDARAVTAMVGPGLRQALFATALVPWCDATGGSCLSATCPTPEQVQERFGPRVVALCVHEIDQPACSGTGPTPADPYCNDSPMITVRLTGYVAALVPPGFSPGGAGELLTDVSVTTHTLRFAP